MQTNQSKVIIDCTKLADQLLFETIKQTKNNLIHLRQQTPQLESIVISETLV